MSPGTRYRRVRCGLWQEPPFKQMTSVERELAVYILTGPQTTQIGLFLFSLGRAAEDLRVSLRSLSRRFDRVRDEMFWKYDPETHVLWIPEWARDNDPPNPNVVQSWRDAFDEVPDSPLKEEAMGETAAFLRGKGDNYAEAFGTVPTEAVEKPLERRFGQR